MFTKCCLLVLICTYSVYSSQTDSIIDKNSVVLLEENNQMQEGDLEGILDGVMEAFIFHPLQDEQDDLGIN